MDTYAGAIGRAVEEVKISADLCIVGGGLAGTSAAITAAREGVDTVLVHDRPVLGGNGSSEVRLWTLGATSHGGNNNRWAREGGVINEILVENMFRNPEGNPIIFDTILLDLVTSEPRIRLLLNTAVHTVETDGSRVSSVTAYNSQNETSYRVRAPFFVDSSGDGVVAYQAGVPFRFGAEKPEEFGEKFAPDPESYGERLGHSIFFYTKDTGRPVRFVPPAYALEDVKGRIPRYRDFGVNQNGCQFWWIEYGGRLDTVHDTETIKWELWKVVLGVWNHIKNSGEHPESENLTLEWVGAVPGKRESRRFEGHSMLTQHDIVEQRHHSDAVSFGGWSIDLHPADGVYSPRKGCDQYHAKGVYEIPFGTMVTPHMPNLLLAGRITSASHVAFGSTRVMGTCSNGAQAAAMAVAVCRERDLLPAALLDQPHLADLQRRLARVGQYIPGCRVDDPDDLARSAEVSASTTLGLDLLAIPAPMRVLLDATRALLLPLSAGRLPKLRFRADVAEDTTIVVRIMHSAKPFNFTPEVTVAEVSVAIGRGTDRDVVLDFSGTVAEQQYGFVVFDPNPAVRLHAVPTRVTGLLTLAKRRRQAPDSDIGVDHFDFWTPDRRPAGCLFAFAADPEYPGQREAFAASQVTNGVDRPVIRPNAWVARPDDSAPTLTFEWAKAQSIRRVILAFDTDWDHPMESVLRGHPESAMPYCVRDYAILDDKGRTVVTVHDHHQTRAVHRLAEPVMTKRLTVRIDSVWGDAPAAIFGVRCFG